MIIDSHTHYAHKLYTGEYAYMDYREGEFCTSRGDRSEMLETMRRGGITLCIEPSTGLERVQAQLELAEQWGSAVRLAFGIHPKHCGELAWEDREKLRTLILEHDIVAVGETGLDYSVDPTELDAACQKRWFAYQIQLAHERGLPLILHSRDAHRDMLQMLRDHRELLHGGVAHCFAADHQIAMEYVELGFAIGIGGKLLGNGVEAVTLQQTVRHLPLSAILVETDAPYIRPEVPDLFENGKQRKKTRNSSLILPAVIERIAQLQERPRQLVEEAIYQNTLRVFQLQAQI